MKELIQALIILAKYGNPDNPTHCEHDVMYICGIDPSDVSDADVKTLEELGFFIGDGGGGEEQFQSYKYGSA
jgi:hypothetical protein